MTIDSYSEMRGGVTATGADGSVVVTGSSTSTFKNSGSTATNSGSVAIDANVVGVGTFALSNYGTMTFQQGVSAGQTITDTGGILTIADPKDFHGTLNLRARLGTLLCRPSDAAFCVSGAHGPTAAALRVAKTHAGRHPAKQPDASGSAQRVLKRALSNPNGGLDFVQITNLVGDSYSYKNDVLKILDCGKEVFKMKLIAPDGFTVAFSSGVVLSPNEPSAAAGIELASHT